MAEVTKFFFVVCREPAIEINWLIDLKFIAKYIALSATFAERAKQDDNDLFLASVFAELNTNLALDSVQSLAFRLSFPLSL